MHNAMATCTIGMALSFFFGNKRHLLKLLHYVFRYFCAMINLRIRTKVYPFVRGIIMTKLPLERGDTGINIVFEKIIPLSSIFFGVVSRLSACNF